MHKVNSIAIISIALAVSTGLFGCGSSENVEKLKDRVQELEAENTSLKAQLAILKDSFAKDKTAQLQRALGGIEKPSLQADAGTGAGSGSAATAGGGTTAGESAAGRAAAPAAPRFTDLGDVATKDMINDLDRLGVFEGTTANQFDPGKPITRGLYAEWLYRAINALEPKEKQVRLAPDAKQVFKDTPANHPQYKYVQALANAGYSIGYEDGTFKPDKPLTREEMLGIKVGVDVGKDLAPWRSQMETVWKFSDAKDVAEKFTGYVHQDFYVSGPNGSNIQRAFGKIGAFRPKQPVTRSEAAATLWQIGQFGDRDQTFASAVLKKSGQ